jgi:hypothetical protein
MSTISESASSAAAVSPVQSLKARIKALQASFTAELKELEKQVAVEFKGVKGKKAPKSPDAEPKPLTAWTAWAKYATSTWKAEFDEFRASQPKGQGGMPSFAKNCKETTHAAEYETFITEYEEAHPKVEKPKGKSKKAAVEEVTVAEETTLLASNSSSSSSSSSSSAAMPEASAVTKAPVKRAGKAKVTKKPKEWKLGGNVYMKNADHQVWECSASGLGSWVGVYDTKEKKIDTGVDEPERPSMD